MGGIGPIPVRAVWEWLDRAGVRDPLVRRHFEDVISAIDVITLRRANKPASPGPEAADQKSPARRRRRQ